MRTASADRISLQLLEAGAAARRDSLRKGSKLQQQEEEEEEEVEEEQEGKDGKQIRVPAATYVHARGIAKQRVRMWPLSQQTVFSKAGSIRFHDMPFLVRVKCSCALAGQQQMDYGGDPGPWTLNPRP